MSPQGGYTAPEALAALVVIGLALGGLTTGLSIVSKGQANAQGLLQTSAQLRAAGLALTGLISPQAPFRSDDDNGFAGDPKAFEFSCGARRCGASLEQSVLVTRDATGRVLRRPLPAIKAIRFSYVGSRGDNLLWPPMGATSPGAWQPLRAVVLQGLVRSTWVPMVLAPIAEEQRYDCEYDIVSQDCRRTWQ
jgi:hypothetical protein